MNSRERVLKAFVYQETDKIPIGMGGHRSAGISAEAYGRLRDHLNLPEKPIRIYDLIQMLAIVDDDVLDYFQADVVDLGHAFAKAEDTWQDWILPSGRPCKIPLWVKPERYQEGWVLRSTSGKLIARMPKDSPYFDQIYFPLADGRLPGSDLPEIMEECMWSAIKIPGPGTSSLGGDQEKIAFIKSFREGTDRAVLGMFGSSLLERGAQLYGHANFYYMLAADPQKVHRLFGMLTEFYLESLEKLLKPYGPYLDIIQFGDDLGMQTGPQISPKMYHELFKPYHQKMWRRAKEIADVKVMLHSCGSIRAFLPDLIDAGIDSINPVQISAANMNADRLKAEFGEQVVFWGGGCDTQQILPNGTEDEIREHVKAQIEILSPGGGFVFSQVHNVQANVSPENIVAMVEQANAPHPQA